MKNNDQEHTDPMPHTNIIRLNECEMQYLIRTREECDVEKQQREKVLYYAFLTAGAIGLVGMSEMFNPSFQPSWLTSMLTLSVQMIIAALFWWRRSKISYQLIRWAVLEDLIRRRCDMSSGWVPLEAIVVQGIKENAYGKHDKWLFLSTSFPILSLLLWHSWVLVQAGALVLPVLLTSTAVVVEITGVLAAASGFKSVLHRIDRTRDVFRTQSDTITPNVQCQRKSENMPLPNLMSREGRLPSNMEITR